MVNHYTSLKYRFTSVTHGWLSIQYNIYMLVTINGDIMLTWYSMEPGGIVINVLRSRNISLEKTTKLLAKLNYKPVRLHYSKRTIRHKA